MSGMNGFPQFTSVREMKDFVEFIEEREKKAKEGVEKKDKEKKKDTIFGLTERELRWYMFFLSPVIGMVMASVYIGVAVLLYKAVKALFGV